MNNDNTIDNFEETFDEDFFTSKPIYTHFSIDIAPESRCDFENCSLTAEKLKDMRQGWSCLYKKPIYEKRHWHEVKQLLQVKQIAFSFKLEQNPFTTDNKKIIGKETQDEILMQEIRKYEDEMMCIAEKLKIFTCDFEETPSQDADNFTLRNEGHELYKLVEEKRKKHEILQIELGSMRRADEIKKETLIKKMEGMSKVEVAKSSGVSPRTHNKRSIKQLHYTPKKQWLINEILGVKDMVMIYSAPGCGKTFIALDLIGSAITGRKWANKFNVARPLNVAYCTGEGLQGIKERFDALWHKYGIDVDDENNTNFSFYDDTPQLFDLKYPANSQSFISEWLADVKQGTEKPLDIIVIDTLHNATKGLNENATDNTGVAIHNCNLIAKELGCSVILVHHSTKDGTSERGSTSWRGSMDSMIEIKENSIRCSKSKHGKGWLPASFNLVEVVGTDSACVEWTEYVPPTSSEIEKNDTATVLKVLKFFSENKGKFYTLDQISNELGWSKSFWGKFLKKYLDKGVYSSSAIDPSKPVYNKNQITYGIKL